ncbi:hypothetical protein M0R45_007615 [Rubus argutus]|uniref:F-box protein n=1 Tax=Rubus argutus TaxID=59490 RepID=A0AAW1Y164_RUBAR
MSSSIDEDGPSLDERSAVRGCSPILSSTSGEGFIFDPYYTDSSSASTSSSSTIHINDDYRWIVVRINSDFDIEIFSSKTGTPWKGKLYWLGENKWQKYDDVDIYEVKERRRFPFTLELDPLSASAYPSGHIIDKYRIIEGPLMDNRELTNLFVSHGCLWACTAINVEVDELGIWELKEDQEVDGEEVVGGRNGVFDAQTPSLTKRFSIPKIL